MMNFERALQILSKDIEEIENILSGIEKTSLPDDIELALSISKLKNLKDNFSTLSRSFRKMIREQGSATPAPPSRDAEPVRPEEEPVSPAGEEETTPAQTQPEKEIPPEKNLSAETAAEEEGTISSDVAEEKKEKEKRVFLSDTFEKKQAFRNESLGKAHPADVSSSIKSRPVSDLRRAIGLNEKFMFIRDLFGGDSKAYDEAIRYINNAASREEVNRFLERFKWNEKKEAVREFRNLVERKLKSLKNG